MLLRPLHDDWTLRAVAGPVPRDVLNAGPIPATVPGTVHTDLLAAGLIPDPYLDDHERQLAWIGLTDWRYETTFDWTVDHPQTDLVFAGLDTVAHISLNGQWIGATRNMHRTYSFDIHSGLRAGGNSLAVTFGSAVRHADQASLDLGPRPHVNHHPYNAIRKMACNFGWDWGPDLVTAGIWRPVTLRAWSGARLSSVRPVTSVVGADGQVDVHLDVVGFAPDLEVTVSVGLPGAGPAVVRQELSDVVRVPVAGVRRWWPRGHGEQPLYDVVVSLSCGATVLDEWRGRVGFRTVRLDVSPSGDGTAVGFVVNDRPVFIKGANWIPDDVFPHRVTPSRYAERLDQAEEAGLNLLRVWGGGIYEADAFYDECDRRGILTWQDFLFACAAYSEEEPLRSEVVAEARDNVTRLMPHPSLVLWNGNNENLWGHADWNWPALLDGRTWGAGYYHEVLPSIVDALDPGRPYSAGSPWSFSDDHHPNDPDHGTMHIWDVWNQRDYLAYRDYRPRFVAEFGWQGPPAWSTLRRALSDDPLTPESPGMLTHQKAAEGNVKLTAGLVAHLRQPDSMLDWHWAMSLNQARAVRTGIEYFRSLSPHCTGSVMWQLNDCWPVVSWAAVDGDGRRKPLFYGLRHAHADRLVTVQPGLVVALVNDTSAPWSGPLRLARQRYDGTMLACRDVPMSVPPWSTLQVPVPAELSAAEPSVVFVASVGSSRSIWSFVEDRDADLPAQSVSVAVDGCQVTVTAHAFVRDLALLADRLDPAAVVSDMLVTLFPGESVTWDVHGVGRLDPVRVADPTVLRSANQLATLHPPGTHLTSGPPYGRPDD